VSKKTPDMHSSLKTSVLSTQEQRRSDKIAVWFSRVIRWGFGILFIGGGIYYYGQGGWPAIIFGAVFFATGFFRPKRCLEEGGCALPRDTQKK